MTVILHSVLAVSGDGWYFSVQMVSLRQVVGSALQPLLHHDSTVYTWNFC